VVDLNRLREIVRGGAARPPVRELTYEPDYGLDAAPARPDLEAALGAAWADTPFGRCLVVERRYEGYHGDVRLSDAVVLDDEDLRELAGAWSRPDDAGASCDAGRVIFFDLETTGLSGGAGMCAFLVGCGFFDGETFVTRQFFLPTLAAERALLAAVADWLGSAGSIVTFNGKTFDLPVMETRWLFHRMDPPPGPRVHLDMLHPARCLWKGRSVHDWSYADPDPSRCSLGALERVLLGVRRAGDVPGFEIPSRYFHYVRSGDVAPLEPVLEHNRLDLLSLAAVTARALKLVRLGPLATEDPRECLSLGRVYERMGREERALVCYRRAAGLDCAAAPDQETAAEALRRLAVRLRRERRHSEAASMWQEIFRLGRRPPSVEREAAEALAVHHEHRARDLTAARQYALRALASPLTAGRERQIHHRLARLDRKIAVQQKGGPKAAWGKAFQPLLIVDPAD
jgi:uncharacterized protein YprB with RNaseH-like and TPR domain